MGTALGDALAKKGLVDQKRADEEATKLYEKREHRRREEEEDERRALDELGNASRQPLPAEWRRDTEDDR